MRLVSPTSSRMLQWLDWKPPVAERPSGGWHKLNQLLEATALLHSQLPLDEVLATMLDHAVSVTGADHGLLLESDAGGALKVHLARRSGRLHQLVANY